MRVSLLVMLLTLLYGCGERIERVSGPTMGSTFDPVVPPRRRPTRSE